ncbi:restriction endonuclease [Streptococcus chenjunshii]|uniref:Restriction endonuclease n=2 Tax=Streptococcus TaxID=1301 RepID=A0A372KL43_9STRE|nr:restriction endonuclease [Streptococcus chenjunshii]AXQ77756.1 restriction endonuclease [Streptococcus chenjunshii]RFU50478.1 restriction endonuclease [Streptococcus chenjunshii]RFU52706.1 restriction endonuclease [Streptococcus chenjunshii]
MINLFKFFLKDKQSNTQNLSNNNNLQEQLNYTDITVRRPFDKYSFMIEDWIFDVLSSKSDTTGQKLVNLVIHIFQKMGYEAKNNDGLTDHKKDILVYKQNETIPHLVIQCKSYSPQTNHSRISKNEVAAFMGYTEKFKHNRIFITSSYFEKGTVEDFSDKITLIDRIGLIQLLTKYFPNETTYALNAFSLHSLEHNCVKCQHGKLQLIYYGNIPTYKCTNCTAQYKAKDFQPVFKSYAKYRKKD